MVDGEDDASAWLRRRNRLCHPERKREICSLLQFKNCRFLVAFAPRNDTVKWVGSVTRYEAFSSSSIVVISDCA